MRLSPRVLLLALFVPGGCTGLEVDLYPLYRAGPTDAAGGWEWEALGPLFYGRREPPRGAREWGWRPLLRRRRADPGGEVTELLWPLGRFARGVSGWSHRFAPLYYAWGHPGEGHWRLYPCFFVDRGRGGDGEAFFPLCGHLRGFFGMPSFRFVLFPLYARTERGHHVLWPLGGWGPGWLRLLPLHARSRDARGEAVTWLWPLYSAFRGPRGRGFHLWPLYGRWRGPGEEGWTVLFPLVRVGVDRRRGRGEVHAPFPFFERWWGPGREGLRVWPLFGTYRAARDPAGGTFTSRFVLWPCFWYRTEARGGYRSREFRFLPFLTRRVWRAGARRGGDFYLWPLWEDRRGRDGTRLVAVGTFVPWWRSVSTAVHDHWGVFLSAYLRREEGRGRVREQSWLGVYRRWRAPGFHRWTVPLLWAHREGPAGTLDQFLAGAVRLERSARGEVVLRLLGVPLRLRGPAARKESP